MHIYHFGKHLKINYKKYTKGEKKEGRKNLGREAGRQQWVFRAVQ